MISAFLILCFLNDVDDKEDSVFLMMPLNPFTVSIRTDDVRLVISFVVEPNDLTDSTSTYSNEEILNDEKEVSISLEFRVNVQAHWSSLCDRLATEPFSSDNTLEVYSPTTLLFVFLLQMDSSA